LTRSNGAVIRVMGIAEKNPADEIWPIEYCGVLFSTRTVDSLLTMVLPKS
jgi:hypothetical protein